ncbi:hypothetical protein NY08_2163 [Rhodococcus sp. B7740]|nr:hypothetical protein NY08_2163 [Rhodococcus sp. B7740]
MCVYPNPSHIAVGRVVESDRVAQAFVELMSISGSLPHIDRNTSREMFDGTPAADAAFFAANRNGRNRIALARPHIAESSNRG